MRGKGQSSGGSGRRIGITPAYAGKSAARQPVQTLQRDHPRLCGEKPKDGTAKAANAGSPPPMRGKEASHLVYE